MKKKPGLRAKPIAIDKHQSTSPHEEAERAFVRLLPEREALEQNELVMPRVDVARAVGAVLASMPAIVELLPEMKRLPSFDPAAVDGLREVALAAEYANAVYSTPPPDRSVNELATEARALQHQLLAQARALGETGNLEADAVARIRLSRKHSHMASNLIALATLFRQNWASVVGKTRATEEAVERAGALGVELLEALGSRDVARSDDHDVARAADARTRAFTLLAKRYDQVRRAVAFLRWNEGDADVIAPSLYVFRGERRSAPRVASASVAPPTGAPAAPTPAARDGS